MFTKEKLKASLLDSIEQIFKQPESTIFQKPVDLQAVPRYIDIIKTPIDLGTIKKNILYDAYVEPWQYINDIRLMFNNACTFNKKNTLVHIYATQVSKLRFGKHFFIITAHSIDIDQEINIHIIYSVLPNSFLNYLTAQLTKQWKI